jgi:ACT domain-containing protein
MSGSQEEKHTHTIRLELIDEPGELLRALKPIAESRGNLLSIFHERGNVTPRGHIPIEVDVEATPDRFEDIVESLRSEGINVVQAVSSARVRLATAADETNTTINVIREIATEKDLRVIEPLVSEGGF